MYYSTTCWACRSLSCCLHTYMSHYIWVINITCLYINITWFQYLWSCLSGWKNSGTMRRLQIMRFIEIFISITTNIYSIIDLVFSVIGFCFFPLCSGGWLCGGPCRRLRGCGHRGLRCILSDQRRRILSSARRHVPSCRYGAPKFTDGTLRRSYHQKMPNYQRYDIVIVLI